MNIHKYIVAAVIVIVSGCAQSTPADKLINKKASLPTSFSISKLDQRVLSSYINTNDSTTSVLCGDALAAQVLQSNEPSAALSFSFTLVTWHQQADPHWYGANIPGDLISVEQLSKKSANSPLAYQKLSGKMLKSVADTTGNAHRIYFILKQKPMILP